MKQSSFNLEDAVVSATRWSQKSSDVPSKIVSISPKKVRLQNPQTAADLLGVSDRVFIQKSQQGGGSPMIRGFATNRLLYAVDGVRMNTAIFRGGNIQNVISLDPFAISNTEILFGPGSVIYGSDAIGGVMSFNTLSPQLSVNDRPFITGRAATRYSSANNENTGHFHVNVGWEKWALLTSISANDYGDLRMGSYGPDEYLRPFYVQRIDSMDVVVENDDPKVQIPSAYTQINLMQKVRYKLSNRWNFEYGFHYSETSEYGRYDRHIRYQDGGPRYGEWSYGPQKWMMNNFTTSHIGENIIYDLMTIRLAQQSFQESRLTQRFQSTKSEKCEWRMWKLTLPIWISINPITNMNKLFYGAELVLNDVISKGHQ